MKVLIADDDRALVQLLVAGLKKRGIETLTALDAMQAVMVALRQSPDVVLLDINMPGGTGIEAIKRIKGSTRTSAVPVIAMTGTASEEARRTALEMGALDCLEKPLDVDQLAELLGRVAAGD